ncbi:MAG: nicotinate-nucleotide--dimethylbenzimidazole phosphoribosyltransferase [Chloroherpetonaceae bacterium]|nr:nicotinate-nucleotide--dimethylbenzimidazole phosphoribosyltransferase [Chloroherpetonaceae bacterium]MCS7211399.1 nicotinate-nucleotide--dimethylbenzimidazole phosphoribosyltransferase [Chloroherpetonaceae bacterium]MDW8020639.1 nicotinate-nucleotide--dimethylbenzimidazole phosphoribosyltransferase [Chloroherpetonaceae bacterium]MDW8465669.1 nicotinate-nucleotide--dimethylbenzimidazole phosphoribosyltransferase [Chloroherpetonaceae bacterium]
MTSEDGIRKQAQEKFDQKTKPQGSLGRLEELGVQLAAVQNTLTPRAKRKRMLVFAASHGIADEGVSAYPKEVTAQMTLNFLQGGAAINVLARLGGIDVRVINAGVEGEFSTVSAPNFRNAPIRQGTRNFLYQPAMTKEECQRALELGKSEVEQAKSEGIELLGIGEMGIGNTTAASALCAALLPIPTEYLVGRGTGIDDERWAHKVQVVKAAIALHQPSCITPEDWLAAVGGYEIAAMTGAILAAFEQQIAMVVDGFIATAAALVAVKKNPAVKSVCFFGHCSDEAGHRWVLSHLGVEPILSLKMRLGEGTGAALAMHIIEAAANLLTEMATFESAGVSQKTEVPKTKHAALS